MSSPSQSKVPKGHVNGLAKVGDVQFLRELLLKTGTLLRWPSPKTTGVISMAALRLNKTLMRTVALILGPQSSTALGLYVTPVKIEASKS